MTTSCSLLSWLPTVSLSTSWSRWSLVSSLSRDSFISWCTIKSWISCSSLGSLVSLLTGRTLTSWNTSWTRLSWYTRNAVFSRLSLNKKAKKNIKIYSNENFYKFVGQIGKLVKLRKYTRSFTNKVPVLTDFVLMLLFFPVFYCKC